MRIGDGLRWLPVTIGLCASACSSSSELGTEPTDLDPGRPASEYGPKCYVDLIEVASGTKLVSVEGTVSAASTDRMSHVFFDFSLLPPNAQRVYLSLVLDTVPLAAGMYASARAGSIDATLADGRRFAVTDLHKEGSFQLIIDRALPADGGTYYLTGLLNATLQDVQNPSSSLQFASTMNVRPTP